MSNETKFTKGEWVADIRVGCCAVYPKDSRDEWEQGLHNDDDNIYYKGYTNVATNPELAFRSKEKIANAYLIKTAPKLYEMLEGVMSELQYLIDEVNEQRASKITSQTENEPDYHDQQTLHEIQGLLAEARGE